MQGNVRDFVGVLRGVRKVVDSSIELQVREASWRWNKSSIRHTIVHDLKPIADTLPTINLCEFKNYLIDRSQLLVCQNKILLNDFCKRGGNPVEDEGTVTVLTEITDQNLSSNPLVTPISISTIDTSNTEPALKSDSKNTESSHAYKLPAPLPLSAENDVKISDGAERIKTARQRKVPSSRLGRIAGFGNLAVGLGLGAASEWTKRKIGLTDTQSSESDWKNPFLTDANMERLVDTLCRMRGAALKLGQMLSIQDETIISPQLQRIFERVRQAADFMPVRQMHKVLSSELGPDWSDLVDEFDDHPFAAASIGQVHRARLKDGSVVAMKIQYPGVADSIDADVDNLMYLVNRLNILPRGLFAERAVSVMKIELRDECNYRREAAYCKRFAELLTDDPVFTVPRVIEELTTAKVLTCEYVEGMVLDDCLKLPQNVRNWIGEQLLRLCLREVFVYRVMQTDPNWSNFLYNPTTGKIVLLDFGASREFARKFVDPYLKLIHSAAEGDRDGIVRYSEDAGFLTSYETKAMVQAHVDAVNILGEAFASPTPFDFGHQSMTRRINNLIPVMLEHRLSPPPEESYSLHRKMSGCFLLCNKIKAVVHCRPLFYQIWNEYVFDDDSESLSS